MNRRIVARASARLLPAIPGLLLAGSLRAQDLDPRAYSVVPLGPNVAALVPGHAIKAQYTRTTSVRVGGNFDFLLFAYTYAWFDK